MCHDRWLRRERWRDERFDRELRFLLDEEERRKPPMPVVEHEPDEELAEPERLRVDAGTRL